MKGIRKCLLSIIIALAIVITSAAFPETNMLQNKTVKARASEADYGIVWLDDESVDPRRGMYVDENGVTQTISFIKWTDTLAGIQNGVGKTASNSLPGAEGNYYLNGDVTITAGYDSNNHLDIPGWVAPNGTTKLCLNGKTVFVDYSGDQSGFPDGIRVKNNSTLDLYDTQNGGGSITCNDSHIYRIIEVYASNFNMYGGILTGMNFPDNYPSAPLVVDDGATAVMYGGSITGNISFSASAVMIMSGSRFVLSGGSITNNTNNVPHFSLHSAVDLGSNSGVFEMSGGRIANNTGASGGVSVCYGTFTMTGGEIFGNQNSNGDAANVYIGSAWVGGTVTMTMTGGKIDGGFIDVNNDYATVTFNKNDGTGASETQYIKKSTATVLKNVTATRTAGTFNGWNSVIDGSGDTFTAGQSVTLTNDLDLYAQWILDPATAPTIDTQPTDLALTEGYTSGNTLSVGATVATDTTYSLSYQWYSCDDTARTNPQTVTGAAVSSYTIPAGKSAGTTEYYYCDVTATRVDNGESSSVFSAVVSVIITEDTSSNNNTPVYVPTTPDPEPTPVPNPEIRVKKNPDGSVTTKTTTRHDNGSVTVEEKTEFEDGSYTLVSETKDKDGNLISRTDEAKTISKKGTAVVTTKTVNANGSTLEKVVKKTKKGHTETSSVATQATKKGNTIVTVSMTDSDGYELSMGFTVKKGVVTLTSFEASEGLITIPDEITANGVTIPVAAILKGTFKNNTTIINATIGRNVTVIGSKAFYGAKNLKRILVYGNLEKVGKGAFKGIAKDALIKIKADKENYNRIVELIKASGIGKNVKFKRIK